MKNIKHLNLILIILLFACSGYAQKLPNVQAGNQWLPPSVKIDGKLSEWNNSLKAYNKATRLEYAIANDDKNLYLAIKSEDKTTTAKILAGGISFIINVSGKNNADESSVITFPATKSAYVQDASGGVTKNFSILSDSAAITNAISQFKEIKVLKYHGVGDGIVSIYNEYGIKTKLDYSKGILICELLIPCNLIGLSFEKPVAFAYNVKLNGVPQPVIPGMMPPPPMPEKPGSSSVSSSEINDPTDFWAKYMLSGK